MTGFVTRDEVETATLAHYAREWGPASRFNSIGLRMLRGSDRGESTLRVALYPLDGSVEVHATVGLCGGARTGRFELYLEAPSEKHVVNVAWLLHRGADGYGENVGDLLEQLDTRPCIELSGAGLMSILASGEEYFEDAFVQVPTLDIEFGVFDSTFLWFRGTPADMQAVAQRFRNTRMR